jgi:short-subunit dehydrogenase
VAILVNNAGSSTGSSLLTGDLAAIRLEMDTHFFGTLAVTRAFTPQLAARSSNAVLTVLSVLSWLSSPGPGAYGAAKSAEWSLTNALRLELAPHGTRALRLPRDLRHRGRPATRRVIAARGVDHGVPG